MNYRPASVSLNAAISSSLRTSSTSRTSTGWFHVLPSMRLESRHLRELVRCRRHQRQLSLFGDHQQQILVGAAASSAPAVAAALPLARAVLQIDARRMLPSKPYAWPLWMTKSLKYGFRPFDVQRSSTFHPLGLVRDGRRRMPMPPVLSPLVDQHVAARRQGGLHDGAPPSHACFHSILPSAGATLVAPAPLSNTTCSTPSIVTSAASCSRRRRRARPARLAARERRRRPACPTAATMTRSWKTSGELAKPHIGTFFSGVGRHVARPDHRAGRASSAFRMPVAPNA